MSESTSNLIIGASFVVVFIISLIKGRNLCSGCLISFLLMIPILIIINILSVYWLKILLIILFIVGMILVYSIFSYVKTNLKYEEMTEVEKKSNDEKLSLCIETYKKESESLPRNKAYYNLIKTLKDNKVVYNKGNLDNIIEDIHKKNMNKINTIEKKVVKLKAETEEKVSKEKWPEKYLEMLKSLEKNKTNDINVVIKRFSYETDYEDICSNYVLYINLLSEFCQVLGINTSRSELIEKLESELEMNKLMCKMKKWPKEYVELYKNLSINEINKVEYVVTQFVNVTNYKKATENKYFSYLCQLCDMLDIKVNREILKNLFYKQIKNKQAKVNKENFKSKVIKELKDTETIILKDEIYPILEKFIITSTQDFDNSDITLEEYMDKMNNLIEYLKHKSLVQNTQNIDIIYLNYILERRKWGIYEENLKNDLDLLKDDVKGDIINRYVKYYGINCEDLLKVTVLSKILKTTEVKTLKLVENEESKVNKEYKMKKFEEELYGIRKFTIHDIDKLNGYEFEDFLAELFKSFGLEVEQTSYSGDYGADLIIKNN